MQSNGKIEASTNVSPAPKDNNLTTIYTQRSTFIRTKNQVSIHILGFNFISLNEGVRRIGDSLQLLTPLLPQPQQWPCGVERKSMCLGEGEHSNCETVH